MTADTGREPEKDGVRHDLQPGFWPEDHTSKTAVGRAIQWPLSDPLWQSRVYTAYLKDLGIIGRKAPQETGHDR